MTLRLGVVDCDGIHSVAFTQRLNHIDVAPDHWVDGAQVVVACPGTSVAEPENILRYSQQLHGYGVPLVDEPTDLLGQVDAVLITSHDGTAHRGRAWPFIEAGVPLFVDKPFTCSLDDARSLLAAAERHKSLLWSASSLRYAPEVVAIAARADEIGALVGAATHGPAIRHSRNPGLFHYGVHAVEMLFQLLGTGCVTVRMTGNDSTDVAIGQWSDGRVGTVRGTRSGAHGFGFTAFGERQTVCTAVGGTDRYLYRELLRQVVAAFRSGRAPLNPAELLEPVAFQEAAWRSAQHGGIEVPLATVT